MEKPTGVIQKIIESLQQVNALNTYSPIEKDIILHNLRAAYMIFLNISTKEQISDVRIEKLFDTEEMESRTSATSAALSTSTLSYQKAEEQETEEVIIEEEQIVDDEMIEEEEAIEEELIEDELIEDESIEEEELIVEEPIEEDEQIEEEKPIEKEQNTLNPYFQKKPLVEKSIIENIIPAQKVVNIVEEKIINDTLKPHFQKETSVVEDDILEFIPDAKPHSTLLFDDMLVTKSEKKSLNDLLTEKRDDNSLGAKFQQSYIPDLTKAIAINEKFTFIRELFQNSGVNFSSSIQKLNECENIESAFALMEELKHQYLWDTTSSSYLSLCDLVRRRFV